MREPPLWVTLVAMDENRVEAVVRRLEPLVVVAAVRAVEAVVRREVASASLEVKALLEVTRLRGSLILIGGIGRDGVELFGD